MRAMLDIKLIRENPEKVKQGVAAKNIDPKVVDDFLAIDSEWRAHTKELDDLRAEQKKLSEVRKVKEAKTNKDKIKAAEERVAALEAKHVALWERIPNLPSEDAPVGKDESANKVLRTWGEPRRFDFEPKDHVALGEALGIIDIERAGQVSGSRFAYLKGDLALLEFALVKYAFDVLGNTEILGSLAEKVAPGYSAKPFIPVVPPVMIRPEVLRKMARLEPKEERYYIPSDDLYLIGSAEHTLGPLHMDEVIPEGELPIRYAGFSTSFRRESGSYGKDVRGILRVHQFDKVEMESFTLPEHSLAEQDFIVAIQEYLMQSLGIPYQVVAICTGDMGGPDSRQIDIEAWLPGQNKYRETHTADLMTDYQARRLGTKVRRRDGKTEFVHMNDATAFAISRTPIAIIENYQTKDGKIRIPEVLQKYLGKEVIGESQGR